LFYALQNEIPFAAVRNRQGKFVLASLQGVSEAAENSLQGIPADLRFSLTDPPGADSYPISGAVWTVLFVHPDDNTGPALAAFLGWVVHEGQRYSEPLKFARLPDGLVRLIDAKLALIE
jgi:phosphate transport system substrate-binding protein